MMLSKSTGKGGIEMDRTKESLKLVVAIMRTNNKLDGIARMDANRFGLNMTEFAVLELLYNRGRQPIQKIGERILIASSSTTYVLDKLCAKGLAERQPDLLDRRVTYVEITAKGKELMDEVFPVHAEHITEAFNELSEQEIKTLQQLLKTLNRRE